MNTTPPVTPAEEAARMGMRIAVMGATLAARRMADWTGLARRWESRGFDAEDFDKVVTDSFVDVLRQPLGPLLSSMMQLGRRGMVDSLDIDLLQTDSALKIADAWAARYARATAADLGMSNALVIAQMLPEWLAKRMPAGALALRAKEIYGLDPRSAVSYGAYANSDAKRKDLLGLANRYLEHRAQIFGSVHSFTALNSGRQMLLAEGVAQGYLAENARKVWVTAIDERVCETCGPMDGVAVPVLDTFTVMHPAPRTERGKVRPNSKLAVPPVHPNCRCTVVLDRKFESGIITRTARFSDNPRHLARLVSRVEDLVIQR